MDRATVPEAAVNEDRDPLLREDSVRPDSAPKGQAYREVDAEPKAGGVQGRAQRSLGTSVFAAVRPHDLASGFGYAVPDSGLRLAAAWPVNLLAGMSTIVHAEQLMVHREAAAAAGDLRDRDDRTFLRARTAPVPDADGLQIVDLFSGCGGLTYGAIEGLSRSGRSGDLALAIDHDAASLRVLRETLGGSDARYSHADLQGQLAHLHNRPTQRERELFRHIRPGNGLLLAGPPCQGHSSLNNHTRHDDPRNDLYLMVARAARLIDPLAVVIENVQGIGSDRRSAAQLCAAALEELGYEVTSRRLDLNRLGVPQTRIRHVLVATLGTSFQWQLPEITGRDVRWAIEDLLDIEVASPFDTPSWPTATNQERIDWLFAHDTYDLPNYHRPPCHRVNHSYRSMYGRLRWDAPAQTVTSGFGSMGQGRYVHPLRRRTLTAHEAARLQCLPDFVQLAVEPRKTILATMIGNAAPPLLSARILEALVDQHLL